MRHTTLNVLQLVLVSYVLPLFFYSDYTDLGYAYPMIRPSQELYEKHRF